jgi:nicotinamidase-related amidase
MPATRALIVIDIQNDYFPGGRYPLWNTEAVLAHIESAITQASAQRIPVLLVQHVAKTEVAPFFQADTEGVQLHPRIRAAAPEAPVIVKQYADSFLNTTLEETLQRMGVEELFICGMMTQNCVTHTAISKSAEKYKVTVLPECSTSVDEMIHKIALNALAMRVPLSTSEDAFHPEP